MPVQLIGIGIGIIGLIPIMQAVLNWLLRRLPTRRLLGFSSGTKLDIVVTTNDTQAQEPGVAEAYLTAVGEARGVAAVSRVLSRVYQKKPVTVHMSEDYSGNPEGDLLLLGGPRRNRWSRHFFAKFNREFPVICQLEAEECNLRLGDMAVNGFDHHHVAGVPVEDIGFVILAPWNISGGNRVIFCGGLTTYGTEAAARFIFQDLVNRRSELKRILRLIKDNEAAVIGVHAFIEARSVQETSILHVGEKEMIWVGQPLQATRIPNVQKSGPTPN
jgi:hypothetical protein